MTNRRLYSGAAGPRAAMRSRSWAWRRTSAPRSSSPAFLGGLWLSWGQLGGSPGPPPGGGARLLRILRTLAAFVQRVLRAYGPEHGAPFWGDIGEDLARQLLSLESHLSPPAKKMDLHGVSNADIITAAGVSACRCPPVRGSGRRPGSGRRARRSGRRTRSWGAA